MERLAHDDPLYLVATFRDHQNVVPMDHIVNLLEGAREAPGLVVDRS